MGKKGRKSYYYKFFAGFLLILALPVMTIALIFFQARNKVEEQIVTTNRNILEQFFSHVDAVIGGASDTCMSVVFGSQYSTFSQNFVTKPQSHAYYSYMLKKQLSGYINEKYHDIFVYYPSNDYVISAGAGGSFRLDEYYDFYYAKHGDYEEEFKQVAESPYKKPVLYSMNGTGMDSFLCVAMRSGNFGNVEQEYVMVVILDRSYMKKLLQGVHERNESGISFILGSEKEVLFSTEDIAAEQTSDIYRETNEVYEGDINGTEYMILSRPSEQMDAFYAYAMPSQYFWSTLNDINVIFMIGLLASIALGLLIAYWQSNRIYRPIGQTMGRLQEKSVSRWDAKTSTELEFIERLLRRETEEKNKMSEAVRQGQDIKRNNFIYSLLTGGNILNSASDDIFKENGMTLRSNSFCVAVLQMDKKHSGDMEADLLAFVLNNVLDELMEGRHRSYVIPISADRFGVLINLGMQEKTEDLIDVMEQEAMFLAEHFHVEYTAGVSTIQEGLSGIADAYKEATHALKYEFLLGKGIFIPYSEIDGRQFKYSQTDKMRQLVMHFLKEKNCVEGQVPALVDKCLKSYGIDSKASLDMVECFKFETVNTFNLILHQEGYWSEEMNEDVQKLINSPSLMEFRERFIKLLSRLVRRQKESVEETGLSARAREYIDAHYTDSQLSLGGVADMLGVTPFYLTKLFQEKYQLSVHDYIVKVRLSHAKERLSGTTDSIQTIAVDNGFVDSGSFIRVFKKHEGITPGGYRKLLEK